MPFDGRYPARITPPRLVKFLGVGERQIRVIASDATPDRFGDILDPLGCQLANFRRNPIVLAQHDADQPIAKCASITADASAVSALIEFPPAGVNALSDQYLALAKAGVLGAVSVGFMPLERKPLQGTGGWRDTSYELLELSLVSVPANPSALITERSIAAPRSRADDIERARRIRIRVGPMLAPQGNSRAAELARAMAWKAKARIRLI
jgi:HK97 family phage prohead protease